jgi:murein DD-endopeptidase MepM/ murein hydrolase activator NlpD
MNSITRFNLSIPVFLLLFLVACNTQKGGLFGKRSPHDKYSNKLSDAGLDKTSLGMEWNSASLNAIDKPLSISLPYKETGYFAGERPTAAGFSFTAKKGEQLIVQISITPVASANIFIDAWQKNNNETSLLGSTDSTNFNLKLDLDEDGQYLVRVQPELLRGVEYTLTITTGPSLAFPVRKEDNPRTSSYWGADRDGGSRSHEGIDIFAKKRTPAIAIAEGRVTRVNENDLGGKVVFMRPTGKNYSLYYAHLDSQIVKEGQLVKPGDVVGLIGNTGNARTTPPHLHFGIYTGSGAVDPFPFVNPDRPNPHEASVPLDVLAAPVRTNTATQLYSSPSKDKAIRPLQINNVVTVSAATGAWYKVFAPDGVEGFVQGSSLTSKAVRSILLSSASPLFDRPDSLAAARKMITAGTSLSLLGTYNGFHYVKENETAGWIIASGQ